MSDHDLFVLLSLLVEAALFFKFLQFFWRHSGVETTATVGAMIVMGIFPVNALAETEVPIWVCWTLGITGLATIIAAHTVLRFLHRMSGRKSDREKRADASK